MRCYQCALDNSGTARICSRCGAPLAPGSIAAPWVPPTVPGLFPIPVAGVEDVPAALGYASMGERFLAFQCDATVESLLVGAFLALSYRNSSLAFSTLERIAAWIVPIVYVVVAEMFFHGTIGKRMLRIQVHADSPEPRYPSPFKILLRESLGKFLCGLALGIGFLAGVWNPKKKTWADGMAGTVVVRIGMRSSGFKALLAPVLICANVAAGVMLADLPAKYRGIISDQLKTTELKLDDVHKEIFKSFFGLEPQSLKEYQRNLAVLPSILDRYDHLLAEEQELVARSRRLTGPKDFPEIEQFIYTNAINLRQEIAFLVRKHVQTVLAFDPQKQKWDEVLQDRRQMMQAINLRNNQINRIWKLHSQQIHGRNNGEGKRGALRG